MQNSTYIRNGEIVERRQKKKASLQKRVYEKAFEYLLFIGLLIMLITPFNLGNNFLRATDFEEVIVHRGESLSVIADKYTQDHALKEELMEAIVEINNLASDGKIYPGQKLSIPILKRGELEMAKSGE